MSDCVYDAWMRHVVHLCYQKDPTDTVPGMFSWELYRSIRRDAGNEKGFTYGGLVPAIVRVISGVYGYGVRIQYRIWTPELYIADIRNGTSGLDADREYKAVRFIEDMVDGELFGDEVDRITLQPAVYLLLNVSHAVFSETVPRGGPVMALQVYRGGERTDDGVSHCQCENPLLYYCKPGKEFELWCRRCRKPSDVELE